MCLDVDEFFDLGLVLVEVVIVVKEEVWNLCGNGDNVDCVVCGVVVCSFFVVFLCVVCCEVMFEVWVIEIVVLFGFCCGSLWFEGIVFFIWKFV